MVTPHPYIVSDWWLPQRTDYQYSAMWGYILGVSLEVYCLEYAVCSCLSLQKTCLSKRTGFVSDCETKGKPVFPSGPLCAFWIWMDHDLHLGIFKHNWVTCLYLDWDAWSVYNSLFHLVSQKTSEHPWETRYSLCDYRCHYYDFRSKSPKGRRGSKNECFSHMPLGKRAWGTFLGRKQSFGPKNEHVQPCFVANFNSWHNPNWYGIVFRRRKVWHVKLWSLRFLETWTSVLLLLPEWVLEWFLGHLRLCDCLQVLFTRCHYELPAARANCWLDYWGILGDWYATRGLDLCWRRTHSNRY